MSDILDSIEQTCRFMEEKFLQNHVIPFFSGLVKGSCTFHEEETGSRTVYIKYLNLETLDLKKLRTISSLDLHGNHISDISVLRELKNVTYLDLSSNQITDITPLKELVNIRELYLQNNCISDITPLTGLENLSFIDLSNNRITDVTPLKELKSLKYILVA